MEVIVISIIGLLLAAAVGVVVYWLMRQQLAEGIEKIQDLKMQLSQKELELDFERKTNADIRKQADEKLAEQIKFLQAELTNTTQRLLDVRSEKLEQSNKAQMSSIIDPLKETISKLEKEMKDTQTQHGDTTLRLDIISFICGAYLFKEKNLRSKALDLALILLGMVLIWLGTE